MPQIQLVDQAGKEAGFFDLSDNLFNSKVNEHAVYTVVRNHLANKRQGTQNAKTRGEVRGGGRKPYRQKGTGRARQGSIRAPHYVGGGVVFAPKPRDYGFTVPKKLRRQALHSVLTSKFQEDELIVLDQLAMEDFSTKAAKELLENIGADKKTYLVLSEPDDHIRLSFRNLPDVETVVVNDMNVYDLLRFNSLVMTKEAVEKAEEVFA